MKFSKVLGMIFWSGSDNSCSSPPNFQLEEREKKKELIIYIKSGTGIKYQILDKKFPFRNIKEKRRENKKEVKL